MSAEAGSELLLFRDLEAARAPQREIASSVGW